ncbi:MAG: PD-(D/E)XK nuclease family protein [Clostridia bacterium]|nr:PD-(D/E)XK nuclease family protein [Clostridia bacterium]
MANNSVFKEYFLFTQHSLSTFDSCPLKFRKRYLEGLKWDSFPDENIKKRLEMGNNFHLLAHRYFLGIETGLDKSEEECEELTKWMENLKKSFSKDRFDICLPEYKLRMSKDKMKLEANFDLIILRDGYMEIWDWKTHGENKKGRKSIIGNKLRDSLQTKVYMYVLKEQAALIAGEEVDCDRISMHYWQPDPPGTLAEIRYDNLMHEEFGNILAKKIDDIFGYDYSGFDKAIYAKHCKFCEFSWYCNNERIDFKAIEENEDIFEELEWDNVTEIY